MGCMKISMSIGQDMNSSGCFKDPRPGANCADCGVFAAQ